MLTKEQILGADDLVTEHMDIPEWGDDLWVRTMTGTERDAWEAGLIGDGDGAKPNMVNVRAKLCVRCICNEAGERVFDDAEAAALGGRSARALDRIFAVAQRLNGLGADDVEALAKN